jgi:CheY-like chemotaxis protein
MPKSSMQPEELLSAMDAGKILGISADMVRLLARDGRLPAAAQTVRGLRLFRRSEVEHLAAERAGQTRRHHAVQFYEGKEFLSGFVADFIAVSLRARAPVVVIARESHREAFCERNERLGVNVKAARDSGQLALYDARDVLATFMVGGMPDPGRFKDSIGAIVSKASAQRPRTRLRVYGEMVDLLWADGQRDAAVRLEHMWNELARDRSFALLCAYDMGNFRSAGHEKQFQEICDAHTHVAPSESYQAGRNRADEQRAVALLQQRARALDSEIEDRKRKDRERAEGGAPPTSGDATVYGFLAALSRELRAPLAPLQATLELKRLRGLSAQEKRSLARQVCCLSRLADDLLDYARLAAGEVEVQPQRIDLAEAVQRGIETAAPAIEERGQRVDTRVPAGLLVEAEPARMVQVVANLVSSAACYSRPGSLIALQARRSNGSIRLSVAAPSIGPARALGESAFDPMRPGASGASADEPCGPALALAIARQVVQLHRGSLSVNSDDQREGGEFVVTMPAVLRDEVAMTSVSEDGATSSSRRERSQRARRVLVVDDNEDLASLVGELLQELGHRVEVAHDGAAALELAARFEPNIALLDIGLPGMDGYQLARALRELRQGDIRLIAVTGFAQEADRKLSEEAGFCGHLVKPVKPDMLAQMIDGE